MDAKLLSISAPLITNYLTRLYNLTLKTGTIPEQWKTARVTPIYKGKGTVAAHGPW